MRRRPVALLLGLAVLAALPATASASPVLTENGLTVPAGATVQATSIGIPLQTTSFSSDTCKRSLMHGKVAANTGTQIEIELSSFSLSECAGSSGTFNYEGRNLPWCWRTTKSADSFELRGGKCGGTAASLTVATVIEGEKGEKIVICPYTRTAVTGTFKTSPEDAVFTFLEQEFTPESGLGCQAFKLDINYTMETATSPFAALFIS
jgi:hypothetical protein